MIKMNAKEKQAFNDLQQFCIAVDPDCDTFGWSCVQQKSKKQCIQYLHEPSGLTLQSPGSAHLAVLALTASDSRMISAATASASNDEVTEYSDEADQVQLTTHVITSLDKVILQLQKHANELELYHDDDNNSSKTVATTTTVQANAACKIADVNDVCAFIQIDQNEFVLQQSDTLVTRSTKLRCQLLLCACAVFGQKLLHKSSYTSGYRQHCFQTLLTELQNKGADSAALPMLVEPLLPRQWKKELDRCKLLKGDADTDLYCRATAQADIMQGEAEEGSTIEEDAFLVTADPELTLDMTRQIVNALDLCPLYKVKEVETQISSALSEGWPAMKASVEHLVARLADEGAHKEWLLALKQIVLECE
jgi:hypothetical protein